MGPGCTTVERGAASHRNLSPRVPALAGPPDGVARAHGPHGVERRAQSRDQRLGVASGIEGGQPVPVDVHGRTQEVRGLAVDRHADVDRLAAVDPGHGPQQHVLEAHQVAGHAAAGIQAGAAASRATRCST